MKEFVLELLVPVCLLSLCSQGIGFDMKDPYNPNKPASVYPELGLSAEPLKVIYESNQVWMQLIKVHVTCMEISTLAVIKSRIENAETVLDSAIRSLKIRLDEMPTPTPVVVGQDQAVNSLDQIRDLVIALKQRGLTVLRKAEEQTNVFPTLWGLSTRRICGTGRGNESEVEENNLPDLLKALDFHDGEEGLGMPKPPTIPNFHFNRKRRDTEDNHRSAFGIHDHFAPHSTHNHYQQERLMIHYDKVGFPHMQVDGSSFLSSLYQTTPVHYPVSPETYSDHRRSHRINTPAPRQATIEIRTTTESANGAKHRMQDLDKTSDNIKYGDHDTGTVNIIRDAMCQAGPTDVQCSDKGAGTYLCKWAPGSSNRSRSRRERRRATSDNYVTTLQPKRAKRSSKHGALSFVGDISSTLFGTATGEQIDLLSEGLQTLNDKQEILADQVERLNRELITITEHTDKRFVILQNRTKAGFEAIKLSLEEVAASGKALASHINDVASRQAMIASMQSLVIYCLTLTNQYDMLLTSMEDEFQKFKENEDLVHTGRLNTETLKPPQLEAIIANMRTQIPVSHHIAPGITTLDLYTRAQSRVVTMAFGLLIMVAIPLVRD